MNETSLEKQEMRVPLDYIYYNPEMTIDKLIAKLEVFKKTTIGKGYKNVEVKFDIESRDYGDGREQEEPFISIIGTRLETEEEWVRRLESIKERSLKNIENAKFILSDLEYRNNKIAKIDEALSRSLLKCDKCGTPWAANYSKTCNDCAKKEYEKSNK